jgi:uncharacterized protein YjbI with pentapeptide repeats
MAKGTNRVAWGLAAVLAMGMLGGIGLLGIWGRSYWIARHQGENADLHGALLIHAPLASVNLTGANLRQAHLAGANLTEAVCFHADLSGANLSGANLARTLFVFADLSGANLAGANLSQTRFDAATLSRVKLSGAKLTGTFLAGTNLRGADLRHADLRAASLMLPEGHYIGLPKGAGRVPADVTGARYDAQTRWPQGFDPVKAGAVRVR